MIHDPCGIASIHRKWLRSLGVKSHVTQRARYDFGDVSKYYNADLIRANAKSFKWLCFLRALKYGIIHIHSLDTFVETMRFLNKPIVLEYHGSEIRYCGQDRKRHYTKAEAVLVSTPDLLKDLPKAHYLPNPVDTDLFKPMSEHSDNTALYYVKDLPLEDRERPFRLAKEHGLELTIKNKNTDVIPYEQMARCLNKFSYFIDVRFHPGYLEGTGYLSKIALEALACGLKVIRFDDKIIDPPLPAQHLPENVARELMDIYEELS